LERGAGSNRRATWDQSAVTQADLGGRGAAQHAQSRATTAALRTTNLREPKLASLAPILKPAVTWAEKNGIFFAFVLLCAFFALSDSTFYQWSNLSLILLQISVVGIIAVPQAMLILTGNVDLAVGSVMVLAAMVFGSLMKSDVPLGLAVAAALAVAIGWGVVTGLLVAYLGLSPIVVTLGGLAGARGLAELISYAQTTYDFGPAFAKLGNGRWFALKFPVYLLIITFAIGFLVWFFMPYGRRMTAVGADRAAAHAMGVPVRKIVLTLYVCSGMAAGLAGLIVTSQVDAATLSIGQGMELRVITAVMLGGVAFTGGRGSLLGVLFGVGFIGVLTNGLILLNINQFWSNVVIGLALVAAAALDVLYRRLESMAILTPDEDIDVMDDEVDEVEA
jgi:ribose transport system permease protein